LGNYVACIADLVWLLGDTRTIREDARLYFRRTTWSEEDELLRKWLQKIVAPAPSRSKDFGRKMQGKL
jgi:hypothetical protein